MNKGNIKSKIIAAVVAMSIVAGGTLGYISYEHVSKASSSDKDILEEISKKRSEFLSEKSNDNKKSEEYLNETVRAIIQLKDNAVIDEQIKNNDDDNLEYDYEAQRKEEKILDSQEKVIDKIEKITGNKVLNQSAYLVNSITINATRADIEEIEKIKNVDSVCEAVTYKTNVMKATKATGVDSIRENKDYGYKGDETAVAVIDTGVNYNHPDMALDKSAIPKFTEEQWREKISLLGYGKYFSSKVPFGYDYMSNNNETLSDTGAYHGYHVSGIIGASGKIKGVAPNTQILGLNTLGGGQGGSTDELVRSIEDAVKLGADVINMSLGAAAGLASDEDYTQRAIRQATKAGVLCCVAAGNEGTNDGFSAGSNNSGMTDTTTIDSPGIAKECLTVASSYILNEGGDDDIVMSSYSSWGPGGDLRIKPEITAPGEEIESTYDGSEYATLSGTSMSTPFIAGSATLVLNNIKKQNITNDGQPLQGEELANYIKANLMNTSDPVIDIENYDSSLNIPYSVRCQGAGQVNVEDVIKNKVIATYNGEAKVEIGELSTGSKSFEIQLKNYGDTDARYVLKNSDLYRNGIVDGSYALVKENGNITFDSSVVTVPAKESVNITARVNINKGYKKDSFVEGFVNLDGENAVDLSLPLLGFYGDWEAEPVIDYPIYDGEQSYLAKLGIKSYETGELFTSGTGLMGYSNNGGDGYLGMIGEEGVEYKSEYCAFSPNNDWMRDDVSVAVTMLRGAKEVKVIVLDENKEYVRTVGIGNDIRRKFFKELCEENSSILDSLSWTLGDNLRWDGTVYDEVKEDYVPVKDGQYYIQLEAKLYDKATPQIIQMPIKVDTVKPTITYNNLAEDGKYSFSVKDNLAMESYYYIHSDEGVEVYTYSGLKKDNKGNYILDLKDVNGKDLTKEVVTLCLTDVAGNAKMINFKKGTIAEDNEQEDNNDQEYVDDGFYIETKFQPEQYVELVSSKESQNCTVLLSENIEDTLEFDIVPGDGYSIKSASARTVGSYDEEGDDGVAVGSFDNKKRVDKNKTKNEGMDDDFEGEDCRFMYVDAIPNGDGTYHFKIDNTMNWRCIDLDVISVTGSTYYMNLNVYKFNEREEYQQENASRDIYELCSDLDNRQLSEDMLNSDGTYTVKGQVKVLPEKLIINNIDVKVDEKTKEFTCNVPIHNGVNKIDIMVKNKYDENTLTKEVYLSKFKLNLDIPESEEIITSDKNFTFKGSVESYINGYTIRVNNNLIYASTSFYDVDDNESPKDVKNFEHTMKLKEGENVITVQATNHIGEKIVKKFKVICT